MFGYIAPNMEALNEEQKKRYRAAYCGLCQALGDLSGHSGRVLLSHDMTFLALLLTSLEEPEEKAEKFRCAVHPVKEQECIRSRAVEYAAGMNLILMDLKCEDQIRDDHSRIAAREKNRLAAVMKTVGDRWPEQTRAARSALEQLWEEEKREAPAPDRLGNLSGEMLGAVFVPEWVDAYWKPVLRKTGEGLGRFVYWMDAWEDRDRDRKKRRFNPLQYLEYLNEQNRLSDQNDLNYLNHQSDSETEILRMMEMMIGEATEYFEMLPLEKDLDLLRNVLYSGVWQRYYLLKKHREKKEGKA